LERDADRLRRGGRLLLERRRTSLELCAGRLRALSPRATLGRGYAIVRRGEAVIRSATALSIDDRVDVELGEGHFSGRVEEVQP
jgi:exodeoxyribonuclease VII large subunit